MSRGAPAALPPAPPPRPARRTRLAQASSIDYIGLRGARAELGGRGGASRGSTGSPTRQPRSSLHPVVSTTRPRMAGRSTPAATGWRRARDRGGRMITATITTWLDRAPRASPPTGTPGRPHADGRRGHQRPRRVEELTRTKQHAHQHAAQRPGRSRASAHGPSPDGPGLGLRRHRGGHDGVRAGPPGRTARAGARSAGRLRARKTVRRGGPSHHRRRGLKPRPHPWVALRGARGFDRVRR